MIGWAAFFIAVAIYWAADRIADAWEHAADRAAEASMHQTDEHYDYMRDLNGEQKLTPVQEDSQ